MHHGRAGPGAEPIAEATRLGDEFERVMDAGVILNISDASKAGQSVVTVQNASPDITE